MNKKFPQYDTILMINIWKDVSQFIFDYKHVGIPTTISDTNATTLYYLLYAKYGNNPIANQDITQFKYKIFSIIFEYGPTWEKKLSIQDTLRGLDLNDLINDGSIDELFNHSGTNGVTENTTGNANVAKTDIGTSSISHTGTVGLSRVSNVENSGDDTKINNHAFNPSTTPATNAFSPLNYINEQNAEKLTKGTKSSQAEHNINSFDNQDATTSHATGQESSSTNGNRTVTGNDSTSDLRKRILNKGKLSAYEHLIALLDANVTNEFIQKFKYCFKQFIAPEKPLLYMSEEEEED